MKEENLWSLVADLVQELINYGKGPIELIATLRYYGLTDKQIKDYYGLPFDIDTDELEG
jgi:hypothetical protein